MFGKNPFVRRTVKGGRFGAKVNRVGFVGGGVQGGFGGWGRFPGFGGKGAKGVKMAAGAAGGVARGAMGAAAGALGGVASAAGGAVSAVGALAAAAKAASDKAEEWTKAAEDSARKLAAVSPQMQAIIAKLDVDRMRRDMQTAGETADTTQRLVNQQSQLEAALRPLQADLVNAQNQIAEVINEFKIDLIDGVLKPVWDELKPILEEIGFEFKRKGELPPIFGNQLVDRANQLNREDERRRQQAAANLAAAQNARG
ncbi:hypothetical protein [Limnoglobus roseus]|uniref:Uncharacterized protein n=1 Tax=Limnoglobus roseus TaxID=2598579 RepID=A0A5C1APT6_9BACT|nr:hypothetical protein [Limnoglobus roseus]QEL18878.1 hypothetical protein PX52LOC_05920 [Limnoglobus roseus]